MGMERRSNEKSSIKHHREDRNYNLYVHSVILGILNNKIGRKKMRNAIYQDRHIWIMVIIFMYFCYPVIKDITLMLIGGM